MDLLHPRAVYRRANLDDPGESTLEDPYELRSIRSIQSFTSSKVDQAPLLEYSFDHQGPGAPPPSLKATFQAFGHRFVPRRLHGWKLGALAASILAGFSLVINIIAIGWLASHGKGSGLVEVYNGDCDVVRRLDLWSHLAINAISTLLLGGSNYCMQCLCAPTRTDVDRAHQRWSFVDIGVPSFRNLRAIPRFKSLLWWILALSSIPLHLLYNSAFYKSLSTNDYDVILATEGLLDGPVRHNQTWNIRYTINFETLQRNITTSDRYQKLDTISCIEAYANDFLNERRNLVIMVPSNNATGHNDTIVFVSHYMYDTEDYSYDEFNVDWGSDDPYAWLCDSDPGIEQKVNVPKNNQGSVRPCSTWIDQIIGISDRWQPFGFDVEYCLSETVPETCSYSGNIPIVAVVIVCNLVKMICMFIVAFRLGPGSLITIGDAVASFLEQPDSTTKGRCLLSRASAVQQVRQQRHRHTSDRQLPPTPTLAHIQRRRWAASVSWARWFFTMSLLVLALIISSVLLKMAIAAISGFGVPPFSVHFGAVSPAAVVTGWGIGERGSPSRRILRSILIANLPQTIFSFLYLNLNGLLTTMWVADEWSDFATQRKTLRTSKPRGGQRSTHFLQLPYKISLPLMVLSGVLHWLISQSVFLVVVAEYSHLGQLVSPVAVASCGFSPIAMIITIVLGLILTLATLGLGMRSYNGAIPLVGSCSLAISAACHRPEWDTNAAVRPVQWGVVPGWGPVKERAEVGHCAFTSGEVEPLQEGNEYAGSLD